MENRNGVEDSKFLFENSIPLLDFRSPFARDADRIIHSLAFTRYIDKTQVFSFEPNDLISHRIIHVYLLGRIARYIGQIMDLNLDLIDAITVGHDIGHTPFGHTGEKYLSEITRQKSGFNFLHNVQSYEWLQRLERRENSDRDYENGLNLTHQTLDGIVHHNGECFKKERLEPSFEYSFKNLKNQIDLRKKLGNKDDKADTSPATLEGCVVRFADVISYISRDIKDAIALKIIHASDFPVTPLGDSHGNIITNLMNDLIENSTYDRNEKSRYLSYSKETRDSLDDLYHNFNYPHIYKSERNTQFNPFIKKILKSVFFHSLEEIKEIYDIQAEAKSIDIRYYMHPNLRKNRIFDHHLRYVDPGLNNNIYDITSISDSEKQKLKLKIAVDYISGMTDLYCLRTFCSYEGIPFEEILEDKELSTVFKKLFFF